MLISHPHPHYKYSVNKCHRCFSSFLWLPQISLRLRGTHLKKVSVQFYALITPEICYKLTKTPFKNLNLHLALWLWIICNSLISVCWNNRADHLQRTGEVLKQCARNFVTWLGFIAVLSVIHTKDKCINEHLNPQEGTVELLLRVPSCGKFLLLHKLFSLQGQASKRYFIFSFNFKKETIRIF